jgi:hypothetical protein
MKINRLDLLSFPSCGGLSLLIKDFRGLFIFAEFKSEEYHDFISVGIISRQNTVQNF